MFDLRDVCTLAALALAAVGVAYGSHQRAWARVLELHVNALWSEREARYAQRPLVAPDHERLVEALTEEAQVDFARARDRLVQQLVQPEAQAVALAPDRIDLCEAIGSAQPEPLPLDGARTLVRAQQRALREAIVPSDRRTHGFSLQRYQTDEEREA